MKNLLHIGTVVVLLLVYMLPSPLMASGSTKIYVIDKCNSNDMGTYHNSYYNDEIVADACAGLVFCDSGGQELSKYINSNVRSKYTKCTAVQLYRASSSSSYGKYVVCFNNDTSSTDYPSCSYFSVMRTGGIYDLSNYCNSGYVGANDLGLRLNTSSATISIDTEYDIATAIYTCCKTCGGMGDWSSYTGSIEKANAKSCATGSYAGSCYAGGTAYYRCKANYYSSTGVSSTNATTNQSDVLGCAACPTPDSGWSRTSTAGSTTYSDCYEYQTPTGCLSGFVKRNASSPSAYSSTVQLLNVPLGAAPGYFRPDETATYCQRCPEQDGEYGTSAIRATSVTDCFMSPSSVLTDTSGSYSFTNNCNYSASGSSGCDEYSYRNALNNVFEDVLELDSTDYASDFEGLSLSAIVPDCLDMADILQRVEEEIGFLISYVSMGFEPCGDNWDDFTVDEFFDLVIAAACAAE